MPKTQRKKHLTVMTTTLLLALGIALTFHVGATGPQPIGNEGPWMNAGGNDCRDYPNTICAEWPDYDTNTALVCCVPEDGVVGTYQPPRGSFTPPMCHTVIGERAIN